MTLHWIDISHYQAGLQIARTDAQAVGIKLTEGSTWRDPAAADFIRQTRAANWLMLVYHFHDTGVPIDAELDNFIGQMRAFDLIGEAIPALDWESSDTAKVSLAKAWLDGFEARTGISPWIYMSQATANGHDWSSVARNRELWAARYNDTLGPTGAWTSPIAWQYTDHHSTGGMSVDASHFYGTAKDWNNFAAGSRTPTPEGGLLPMSKLTTYRRRDDLTVPVGEWKNVNLVNEDAEAKQFSAYTGPGPYYAVANLLPKGGGVWAQFFLADKTGDSAEEASHENKVWIPEGGGQIQSYGNIGKDNRQLRLRVQAKEKGVVIDDVQTRVGSV
jgi:GH25 family lysozyme M1 (1,4-beta-N-acetylmuramidase)